MKKENVIKKISGKLIFLIIGVSISLTFYGVRAAWNDHVVSGQTLTATLWNDIVTKMEAFDNNFGGIVLCDNSFNKRGIINSQAVGYPPTITRYLFKTSGSGTNVWCTTTAYCGGLPCNHISAMPASISYSDPTIGAGTFTCTLVGGTAVNINFCSGSGVDGTRAQYTCTPDSSSQIYNTNCDIWP